MPLPIVQNPTSAERAPVGRLAPSPTGYLHLGHARSFLLAWWHIRSRGGRILLRLEDLDRDRYDPGAVDAALRDLEWLGIDWDEAPRFQSEHLAPMLDAIERLVESGRAYPCICTRGDIRQAQSAPQLGVAELRYPGTCRGRFSSIAEATAASGQGAGVRFHVPAGSVTVRDGFAPPHRVDVQAEVGDFLIARRSGAPAYQLAVVVDDAAQGVSEVLRGDDLLSSTARQIYLQEALGLRKPTWFHVPLVLDPAGERLAKRNDALSLDELRARETDPRSVVTWAASVSGLDVDEACTAREVAPYFDLARVPKEPVVVGPETVRAIIEGPR